jgi:hypothetical protein
MTMTPADLIWQTTTTSGTGAFALSAPLAGYRGYSIFSNGSTVPYFRSDAAGNFEDGEATASTTSGVTTLTPVTVHYSSNANAPVNWAAGGKQNVRLAYAAGQAILRRNNGSEWTPVGDAFCANVGAATDGVRGLVRYSSAAVVANAQNTDTVDQLGNLLFRSGGKYYRPGQEVPGLTLTAGATYWLGDNSTPLLTTIPSVSATVRLVRLGKALSATVMHFTPSAPNVVIAAVATGGSASTILRWSSAGALVAATGIAVGGTLSDSVARLSFLFAKGSDGSLYEPGTLVPFTGVVAGTPYYLGTSGALSTTAVAPDGTNTQVLLGFGWDTGVLMFSPRAPVGGSLGAGTAVKLEGGYLTV